MEKIRNLYENKSGVKLLMTALAAGRMGASWETRHPGKMAVLNELGVAAERVCFVKQKHTRRVEIITDSVRGAADDLIEADGMISPDSADVLAVTVADCMPVYLHDEKTGVRALLHSGWKGTGIALEALKIMHSTFGCRPEDVVAVLGPSIGSCCYNVDAVRAAQFENEWGEPGVKKRGGNFYISLRGANRQMLETAGISEIIDIDECTCCGHNLGSYRREGPDAFSQMMVLSLGA